MMMNHIVESILPVFLLIMLGWVSLKFQVVDQTAKKTCATLVSVYVFPALLLMETATTDPGKVLDLSWMSAFFLAMATIWMLVFLLGHYVFKYSIKNTAMTSMLCTFPNMAGMGIPFLTHIIGSSAIISVARANFVVSLSLIPLTLFLLEVNDSDSRRPLKAIGHALAQSIRKPMFLAVVFGAMISFSHTSSYIPVVIKDAMEMTAKACIFISLFAVGLALHDTKFQFGKALVLNLFIKSILSGLVAWLFAVLFHLHANDLKEMVFLMAMPTATIATILSMQWQAAHEEAMSLYLCSTVISVVTLPVFIYLLSLGH